jgi:glyoxylase-like metal-dependent hydrolase (beta-lactamase superfamily II)
MAVIAEVQKLVPGKVIRYLINTHHHFDHSGGVRTYIAHGAILVTHEVNRDFYNDLVLYPYPRLMQPDILSTFYPRFGPSRRPLFETVSATTEKAKFVISDGARILEMHAVAGLNHSGEMLIAYLPAEKILVNADLYSPPAQGAQPPAVNQSMTALRNNIQRLKLDVAQHVPIHGVPGTHEQFLAIVSRPSNN